MALSEDEIVKQFVGIGLNDKVAQSTLKNGKLCTRLLDIISEVFSV